MECLIDRIFGIGSEADFSALALEVFRLQYAENLVYREYIDHLKTDVSSVTRLSEIPFLPIRFFRDRMVITGVHQASALFESSGTTGQVPSKHHIISESVYQRSLLTTFQQCYGAPENLCILALLPSYLERSSSSLVYMMEQLIDKSGHPDSGFYLDNLEQLSGILQKRTEDGAPTLLLGVSFALLDLAERYPIQLTENITIMETGGMKGRRKEMIREELHGLLKLAFGVKTIHSEYGMTELLSQAYSVGDNMFHPPPWMRVLIRDASDPFTLLPDGRTGGLNIIDLANLYSCAFIETGDLGLVHTDRSFEVRGRFDHAEVRGCNLMVL